MGALAVRSEDAQQQIARARAAQAHDAQNLAGRDAERNAVHHALAAERHAEIA